jgi:hypothetical protein
MNEYCVLVKKNKNITLCKNGTLETVIQLNSGVTIGCRPR